MLVDEIFELSEDFGKNCVIKFDGFFLMGGIEHIKIHFLNHDDTPFDYTERVFAVRLELSFGYFLQ